MVSLEAACLVNWEVRLELLPAPTVPNSRCGESADRKLCGCLPGSKSRFDLHKKGHGRRPLLRRMYFRRNGTNDHRANSTSNLPVANTTIRDHVARTAIYYPFGPRISFRPLNQFHFYRNCYHPFSYVRCYWNRSPFYWSWSSNWRSNWNWSSSAPFDFYFGRLIAPDFPAPTDYHLARKRCHFLRFHYFCALPPPPARPLCKASGQDNRNRTKQVFHDQCVLDEIGGQSV